MIDDRNTEVGAKLNYKDIIRESPSFEAYYRFGQKFKTPQPMASPS